MNIESGNEPGTWPGKESREEKAEKYYQEIEAMADGVGLMREFLVKNHRPDHKNFEKNVINTKDHNLPESVREKLSSAFLDYQNKSEVVDNNKRRYEELYSDNPKEFFQETFGFMPRGKFEIIWHLLGVHFLVSKTDYDRLIDFKRYPFTKRPQPTEGTERPQDREGGIHTERLGKGEMSDIVSVGLKNIPQENKDQMFDHEMQHLIHHNFFASDDKITKEFHGNLERQTAEKLLKSRSYLETFRNILGERWRDEVLAFYASSGEIKSAQEIMDIDIDKFIVEFQDRIFKEYLKDREPKLSLLVDDPELRPDLIKAVFENDLDSFIETLTEAAEKHKIRIPTDEEAQELFEDISNWQREYFLPLFKNFDECRNNFYQDIINRKQPLIEKLISQFGEEKAFNLLSITHFSKWHHLEKLMERQKDKQVPPEEEVE